MQAQAAEIAQQGSKIADAKPVEAKPADDLPLRRVVAAALLDVLVRTGDPYPAALATAKALAPNADALKPLEQFAATGVPNAGKLSGELLTLVPKLSPAVPQDTATTGSGIVERLQAGAAKAGPHRAHRYRQAAIAAPWWRGRPRRRCATMPMKRGAN